MSYKKPSLAVKKRQAFQCMVCGQLYLTWQEAFFCAQNHKKKSEQYGGDVDTKFKPRRLQI